MIEYTNLDKLLSKYSNLYISEYDCNHIPKFIQGTFIMDASHNGVHFVEEYYIKIDLVNYEAPFITETGGHISKKYPHKYCDNGLCLGITTEILMKCCTNNIFDLFIWFEDFVIPYFFSYEYYNLTGEYPVGERSHGNQGILEYYMDIFNLQNINQAYHFIKYASTLKQYRGHFLCPCGSMKKIRNCHKNELMKTFEPYIKERILVDLKNFGRMNNY